MKISDREIILQAFLSAAPWRQRWAYHFWSAAQHLHNGLMQVQDALQIAVAVVIFILFLPFLLVLYTAAWFCDSEIAQTLFDEQMKEKSR